MCIIRSHNGFSLLSAVLAVSIASTVILVVLQANSSFRYGAKIKSSIQNQTQLSTVRNWVISQAIDADSDMYYEPLKEAAGNTLPATSPYSVDPWGHAYRYCTWDLGGVNGNATYSQYHFVPPVAGLIARVISAGADGTFATACTAVALLGDDSWSQVFNTDIIYGASSAPSGWTFNGTDTSQSNTAGKVLITNGQVSSVPAIGNDIVNKGYVDASIAAASLGGPTDCKEYGPAVPAVGGAYCGGFYAGKMRDTNVGGIYALIVSPRATGTTGVVAMFKTSLTPDNIYDFSNGLKNTLAVAADTVHPLAAWARSLNIGGYTDWYIPARDELELLYRNFKPGVLLNVIGSRGVTIAAQVGLSGQNGNSIPPGDPYGLLPIQTTVPAFIGGSGAEAFDEQFHCSSTESETNEVCVWAQNFAEGYQDVLAKTTPCLVRVVRRVKITF